MKILISGATGFIGSNLVKKLCNSGFEIYAILRDKKSIVDKRVKVFEYKKDISLMKSFFIKEQFDGVVHLASLFLSQHKSENIKDLIDSNIRFGTELLECSKLSNVKWFINTGTFWQNYQNEEYNPVNLYAATKEAFEKIAKFYTQTSSLVFVTIKLNDTFGENDTRAKIFNLWQKVAKSGKKLDMSKGEQIIDISYIEDVVSAYETMIKNLNCDDYKKYNNKTYVVSNREKLTLKELSILFEKILDVKLNIDWGAKKYREREVMIPFSKGELVPNWKQKYDLKEAIKRTANND